MIFSIKNPTEYMTGPISGQVKKQQQKIPKILIKFQNSKVYF